MVDSIVYDLERLPNGYAMLQGLPSRGRKAKHVVRKKWASRLYDAFLPSELLTALVLAAVGTDGIPDERSSRLYYWLLKYVFQGNRRKFYAQWEIEKGRVSEGR